MGLSDVLGLSKSCTFVATVTVHELIQVPLVSGKFQLKWAFKQATSSFQIEPASAEHGSSGKIEQWLHPITAIGQSSASRDRSRSGSPASSKGGFSHDDGSDGVYQTGSGSSSHYSRSANRSRTRSTSPPLSPEQTPNPNKTPTASHHFNTSSFGNDSGSRSRTSSGGYANGHGATSSVDDSGPRMGRRGGASDFAVTVQQHTKGDHSEPKGSTTLIPIQNYTIGFNRTVKCAVNIPARPIDRTGKVKLQPCPLKLEIWQGFPEGFRSKSNGHKKESARLGKVVLDLSQFVGNGKERRAEPRQRRFLLKQAKMNATLQVTVRMEHVAGEKLFVAPDFTTGYAPEKVKSSHAHGSSTGNSSSKATPLNRSTSSLNGAPSSRLGRTHSASTMSTEYSMPSSSSKSPQRERRGWRVSASLVHDSAHAR